MVHGPCESVQSTDPQGLYSHDPSEASTFLFGPLGNKHMGGRKKVCHMAVGTASLEDEYADGRPEKARMFAF